MNTSEENLIIAEKVFGWRWVELIGDKNAFVPPITSPRSGWAAIWGDNNIPNWLPDFINEGDTIWIAELGKHVKITVELVEPNQLLTNN